MSSQPADEANLRRPEFSEGRKVKLADGQEWTFPKPWLRLVPRRGNDGKIGVGGGPTWGTDYNEMLDEYAETEEEDFLGRVALQFRMACLLLVQNYELSDKQLESLLVMEPGNPDNEAMWTDEIRPLIFGQSPKPSADGSATPSSPTA